MGIKNTMELKDEDEIRMGQCHVSSQTETFPTRRRDLI